MSFKNYEYKRPNTEELQEKFTVALEQFENVKTVEEQKQVIGVINEIRNDFGTMGNICHIRHSVDTTDPFYKEEQDFSNLLQQRQSNLEPVFGQETIQGVQNL